MPLNINQLEPNKLWYFFEQICLIPHASKKEEQLANYIVQFAKSRNLNVKTDKVGNIVIEKPASKGLENKSVIILQSHLDMVCEKNSSSNHNFDTDPIRTIVDGGWLKAQGTTLGADDGIGVAAQLALLDSNTIQHGPIECLFTIDEETGLTGAYALEPDFFKANILLNLDSEDEGQIFIGCAGGMDTSGKLTIKNEVLETPQPCIKINVSGLLGGHSGDDINKGLANAIKIISRIANELIKTGNYALSDIGGGNLRNAIAREAFIDITCIKGTLESLKDISQRIVNQIISEYNYTEKYIKIEYVEIGFSTTIIETSSARNLINLLQGLPHGVMGMSNKIPGLVETSTNLASIKRIDAETFEIGTSQRSSGESLKHDIANRVSSVFNLAGAKIQHSTGYPGWNPNPESAILKKSLEAYQHLFKKEPIVAAIHAGLECGLFLEKYPDLDMISFGPTIKGAHSPDERLEIASVQKFWDFLLEILKKVN